MTLSNEELWDRIYPHLGADAADVIIDLLNEVDTDTREELVRSLEAEFKADGLRSWQHHVTADNQPDTPPVLSWCGQVLWSTEWRFMDATHARNSVAKGDRLQPCPKCWEAIEHE